jgi:hypothetical protein
LVSWCLQGLAFSLPMEKAKLLSWAEQDRSPRHYCEFWALQLARVQLALLRPIFMNNMAFGSWIPRNSC